MKKLNATLTRVLSLMLLTFIFACGGDDSNGGSDGNGNGNGGRGLTPQEAELISKASDTWICVMSYDKLSSGSYSYALMEGKTVTIHSDGNYTSDASTFGYSGTYTVKDNTITATSVSGKYSMKVTINVDCMVWQGTASNGTIFLYYFMRDKSSRYVSSAKIKEALESESGVWEVTESEIGKSPTTFYIAFKDGVTSGYTFASPKTSSVVMNVKYDVARNYIQQTEKKQSPYLEGGIYIQEITSTTFKGYWCGDIPLTAKKMVLSGGDDTEAVKSGMLQFPAARGGSSIIVNHYAAMVSSGAEELNYSIEWDTEKSAQRWCCYKMFNRIAGKNATRYYAPNDGSLSSTCQYPNDPDLPAQYRFESDQDPYKSSGYDHGHICPSADRLCSTQANYQTFFITNMQPQNNQFNAGIWASMEAYIRTWLPSFDTLYVCKGGTIDKASQIYEYIYRSSHQSTRVNKNHIPVPKYFFMAVLGRKGNTFKATGFWIDQSNYSSSTPKSYAVNIARLQQETGIDFFYTLPDKIESQVENVDYAQMISDWY